MSSAADFFPGHQKLFVRQRKEWTEILIDWETKNQYSIMDSQQAELGLVVEKAAGLRDFLVRGLLRSHRPLEVGVLGRDGGLLFKLMRSFYFLFSTLHVEDETGRRLGCVDQRFGVLYRKYDLLDEYGSKFASIKGPRWRIWTFRVQDVQEAREAIITKKWGGGLREIFSDADTFLIDYESGDGVGGREWSDSERRVIFAAAISIDFDYFENNQGSGGLLGGSG